MLENLPANDRKNWSTDENRKARFFGLSGSNLFQSLKIDEQTRDNAKIEAQITSTNPFFKPIHHLWLVIRLQGSDDRGGCSSRKPGPFENSKVFEGFEL